MDIIRLNAIEKTYGSKHVLKEICLTIKEGEFFTLLGPSGCGKTTLLRIIAGFVDPDSGQVMFEDQDITDTAAEHRNVGMVFQNYALFPFMNVFENVAYGLKIKKEKKKIITDKVGKYLALVNLEGYEHRNVSELSGGEQQRVALARALAVEPKVLLLDEPLSNLDARLRDRMRTELKEIQRKLGITCIFVTHDQKEALTMSDRIAVFNEGKCVQMGRPGEIYGEPEDSFVATFIGETNLYEAEVTDGKAAVAGGMTLTLSSDMQGKYVSIRPQDIRMGHKVSHGYNSFQGHISKAIISGDLQEYELLVEGVTMKVVRLNTFGDSDNFKVGDDIWVTVDSSVIRVLKH